jgi:hypothetical protein
MKKVYRPEEVDRGKYFRRHQRGGSVTVRKEHRHRVIKYNLKYEITNSKQRGSW